MTILPELEAQILRYYHVEKWRVGTIARQLHVHHGTVTRVLAQAGLPRTGSPARASLIDPYLPFLHETLQQFPTLTASRLYAMVRERGYRGGPEHFRHLVACHRPRRPAEAYLRLRSLPGEQGQVDWGHFGHFNIGRARRPLMAFVMVLSYSRQIFVRFFLDARLESFLRGHAGAFAAWQGCPRVLLYDNLKSAVLERQGDAIRFHPTLLAFAAHYRYEPRPVAIARGNEKGRVERAIRYVRDNFFAARQFVDVDDLNAQAAAWCAGVAADRPCPEQQTTTVREAFAEEAPRLLKLCGCWTAMGPPSSRPPSARRSRVASRIPTPCVWRSRIAANNASCRHPSPSICRHTSRPATPPSGRISSTPTTSSRSKQMTDLDALYARAKALRLHGLLAHWTETATAGWVEALLDWEEQERSRRSLER